MTPAVQPCHERRSSHSRVKLVTWLLPGGHQPLTRCGDALVVMTIHGRDLSRLPMPALPSRRERLATRLFLKMAGARLRVEGPDRLATSLDATLFALNHNTSLETVWVAMALTALRQGRKPLFLVDWMFQRLPLVGWLVRRGSAVAVYNKPARGGLFDGYRQAQRRRPVLPQALSVLEAGNSLAIFPEGTRNRGPERLLSGRAGIGWLALRSAAPLLPVGLARPESPAGRRISEWSPIVVRPGDAVEIADLRRAFAASPSDARLASELAREVVRRVMAALSPLCGKAEPLAARRRLATPSKLAPLASVVP